MSDAAQFTETYRRHSLAIYRFALHMSGDASLAEEVTQDTFLEYIRHPHRFRPDRGELGNYLFGIARHLLHRQLQQGRRFPQIEEDLGEQIPESGRTLLENLTRHEDLEALQDAILRLPEKYREAVVLCNLQEMSCDEAAAVLDCAAGTVRSRLHRARSLLAAKLKARCTV